jgi:lipopolysaccharide export system protein LptA
MFRVGFRALLWLLLSAGTAFGQSAEDMRNRLGDQPFTITADHIEYDQQRDVYEATGNVRIVQPGGRLLAGDWIVFNATTRAGVATGNVTIQDGTDSLTAGFAAVNLNTLEAVVTDAEMVAADTGFVVRGELLRKTGAQTYSIESGNFTTCRCPPGSERRPWEVDVASADIEVGGYAVGRHAVVRVLELPVIYVPWIILPVKSTRQSGFLFPQIETSSRNGFTLGVPFFWAARHNLNVLMTPAWLAKRGWKPKLEFELLAGESGYAEGGTSLLGNDREVDRSDPSTRFSDNRWAYWLRAEQPLRPAARVGARIREISDNAYVLDFDDFPSEVRASRFLDSTAFASAAEDSLYGSAVATIWNDLQAPNDLDRDDFQLQRLPDLRLSAFPQPVSDLPLPLGEQVPLRFGLDLRYTYFSGEAHSDIAGNTSTNGQFFDTGLDGAFDFNEPNNLGILDQGVDNHLDNFTVANPAGTEGNGRFDEGELLADRGSRVDVFPRLSLPARLGPIEALAEGGLRSTFYYTKNLDSSIRSLPSARVDLRTRLGRGFRLGSWQVQHVVEPSVRFVYLKAPSPRSDDPLFIPEGVRPLERLIDGDPRLLTENPSDRVPDASFLQYGLANSWFTAPLAAGAPPRLLGTVRLGWGYDFEESHFSNAYFEAEFHPRRDTAVDLIFGWDSKESEVSESLARVSWEHSRGHNLTAAYRFLRDLPPVFEDYSYNDEGFKNYRAGFDRVDQVSLTGNYVLHRRLEVFGTGFYSFEDASTRRGEAGVVLHSRCDCWDLIASVERRTRPEDTRVKLEVRLSGMGFGGRR